MLNYNWMLRKNKIIKKILKMPNENSFAKNDNQSAVNTGGF